MISFLKKNSVKIGLIITVTYAVFIYGMTLVAYSDFEVYTKMMEYLFDCGIDAMSAMASAALFFGCMKQDGNGARLFRTMIAIVSSGFLANFLMYFSMASDVFHIYLHQQADRYSDDIFLLSLYEKDTQFPRKAFNHREQDPSAHIYT